MGIKTETARTDSQTTVAARVAGEDIRAKDMVTVLNEVVEVPSYLWCCSSSLAPADELVRIRLMPSDPGKPFDVTAVCLPFVYAVDALGKIVIFDIRQHHLVRLDAKIARAVRKQMRRALKTARA